MALKEGSFIREHPREIFDHVLDGTIDSGMVSLVSYLEETRRLGIMETANIHSTRNTLSTLLISNGRPLDRHIEIAITAHTRTTEFYLRQVLRAMNVEFKIALSKSTDAADLLSEADYALVIGDEAIRSFAQNHRILLDVGYEFARLYSLPPVYAVTVYRKNMDFPKDDFDILQNGLSAVNDFKKEARELASERLGVPRQIMRAYYDCIRYDFTTSVGNTIKFVSDRLVSSD